MILVPNVPPEMPRVLFEAALDDMRGRVGLINEAPGVAVVDREIQITAYELLSAQGKGAIALAGAAVGPAAQLIWTDFTLES